jgi:hypothetical protein
VRNSTLHAILEAFATDAATALGAATAGGEEIPFEVVESDARPGRAPLYCYRPLTGAFIRARLGLLRALPSCAPAVRALAEAPGTESYLRLRGETQVRAGSGDRGEGSVSAERGRAEVALQCFLAHVFEERSGFGLDAARFEAAYAQLEEALYEGRGIVTVLAPVLGIALDPATPELPLGEGLSLVRGAAMSDAPPEAVYGSGDAASEEPHVLAVLTLTQERASPHGGWAGISAHARLRFRRLLSALRLFECGGYALGPLAWTRLDAGAWRAVPLGASGRPRLLTLIPRAQEDELRGFCNLIARRAPEGGEVGWALARFEMGCERLMPFEALSDYLLALRALLEPEGPASGRLAGRLAALCAEPDKRAELAERAAHTIALERAVIAGMAGAKPGAARLVEELAEHLRALLRDVICGHLPQDVRGLADELLGTAAAGVA